MSRCQCIKKSDGLQCTRPTTITAAISTASSAPKFMAPPKAKSPPKAKPAALPTAEPAAPPKAESAAPPKAEPQKVYVLFIHTRDQHGDESTENAIKLASSTIDGLKAKFKEYLINHRAEEDYLDDDDFIEVVKDSVKNLSSSPELNSAYITDYFELNYE
jgi:hypothetical protein